MSEAKFSLRFLNKQKYVVRVKARCQPKIGKNFLLGPLKEAVVTDYDAAQKLLGEKINIWWGITSLECYYDFICASCTIIKVVVDMTFLL